jgi:hypothetical protein
MSDEYELKLTAEISYGKEVGKHRYTIEHEDSGINIYDFLDLLKSLTLSIGYAEENWKHAIINMADGYHHDLDDDSLWDEAEEDSPSTILSKVEWNDDTEYLVTNDRELHVDTSTIPTGSKTLEHTITVVENSTQDIMSCPFLSMNVQEIEVTADQC